MTIDRTKLRQAAARAIPLSMRGRAASVDDSRCARAERVLGRWRNQPPFESGDWFTRRLALHGLSDRELHALLAESTEALAARAAPSESWIEWLIASFEDPVASIDIPQEHAFARLFAPLLASAVRRLHDGLSRFETVCALGTEGDRTAQFVPALTASVHSMAERTMVMELNVARVMGRLSAATPEGRYQEFVQQLADPIAAVELLSEYPVLARQVTLAADAWVRNHLLLIQRLASDHRDLEKTFGGDTGLGRLAKIRIGLGDRHRGGAAVAGLVFESGMQIIYKPRQLDVDIHFQELLAWLNPHLRYPLRSVRHLVRKDYGWVECVTARPCQSDDEMRRFYRRSGVLLALFYILDATDCHAENVLAAGEHPVAIDLEALLQPRFPEPARGKSEAERLANRASNRSVLRPGMLPHRAWGHDYKEGGADVSALGWTPNQMAPGEMPVLVGQGTDEVRLEYQRTALRASEDTAGRPARLFDFFDELDTGFAEAYRHFLADRDGLRERLRAFADDEVRLLCRDTHEYSSLLHSGFHPDLLRDALDRDRHFDALWIRATHEATEFVAPFLAHEHRDLWVNDVPIFTTRPRSTEVFSASGHPVADAIEGPALESVLRKVDELGDDDLERQRTLCASAVVSASLHGKSERFSVSYPFRLPESPPEPQGIATRALDHAAAIAERLVRLAYRGSNDLAWIGPTMAGGAWAVNPLGLDLYTGTTGLLLFFELLADRTGDAAHRDAADRVRVTLRAQLDRRAGELTNGFASAGGVLFALAHVLTLRPDSALEATVAPILDGIVSRIESDKEFDVLNGCAGTIGGLAVWHGIRPKGRVLDALRACAEHLSARAEARPAGVGWIPESLRRKINRPIAGFAHGGSGIAWALGKAATLLGEPRYADIAVEALVCERTLFDAEAGNWADIREGDRDFPTLWCHGASGIGLSRLDMLNCIDDAHLRTELDVAWRTVIRDGFGRNFSLCHGDLGNLDFLLSASSNATFAPEHARDTTLRHAAAILDGLDQSGRLCGLPLGVESPSLMVGVAGIGYGLLRIAAPQAVPSVLTMAPVSTTHG